MPTIILCLIGSDITSFGQCYTWHNVQLTIPQSKNWMYTFTQEIANLKLAKHKINNIPEVMVTNTCEVKTA